MCKHEVGISTIYLVFYNDLTNLVTILIKHIIELSFALPCSQEIFCHPKMIKMYSFGTMFGTFKFLLNFKPPWYIS